MNEIVKYHNDLNTLTLGGLTENQTNLLFTIFASIKDKGTQEVHFDFDKIVELSGISTTNKEYLNKTIFANFDKLQNLKIRYSTKDYDAQEVIFPKVKISKDKFVELEGKYTKTLYRLLKQFRTSGYMSMKWDKFVDIMDVPKAMAMRDIEKDILKPAIKRLSSPLNLFDHRRTPFKNLKYTKLRGKGRGRPVKEIQFSFDIESITVLPQKSDFSRFENECFYYQDIKYQINSITQNEKKQLKATCVNLETQEPIIVSFSDTNQLQKAIVDAKVTNMKERLYSN